MVIKCVSISDVNHEKIILTKTYIVLMNMHNYANTYCSFFVCLIFFEILNTGYVLRSLSIFIPYNFVSLMETLKNCLLIYLL